MNCTESQDLLQRRLDGEPAIHPELPGHLADCAACRGLHAAAGALDRGLRLRKPILPPEGLRRNIVAAALAERRARKRRFAFGAMAAAASLFLCVGLVLLSRAEDGTARNPFRVAQEFVAQLIWPAYIVEPAPIDDNRPTPGIVVKTPPAPSLRDSVAEAGTAVVALTKRTAEETREQTKVFTEVLPMPLPTFEVAPPLQDPVVTTVWQETGQRVSTGFEPVTSSARRAFSMFVRETPVPRVN